MDHILLGCVFSRQMWHICLLRLQLQEVIVMDQENVMQWWLRTRKLVPKPLRRGFDSFFFLVGWSLWKERNARTFDRRTATALDLAASIFSEAACWLTAGNRHLGPLLARV